MASVGDHVKGKEEIDNVRVSVRCRPLSQMEMKNNHISIVKVDQTRGEITVTLPNPKGTRDPVKMFTFDSVFGTDSTQAEVYNETARPIVDAVLEGYNGTIFAYGQTGTGKTYTMAGEVDPELQGIIPNSFAHIFGHIAKSEGETKFLVRVSYLEIYNEEVRDILSKKSQQVKLHIKERPDVGVYVKDLASFVVKDTEEMDKLMTIGNKNRTFGATDMNERSSRSHTIFTITVEQSEMGPDGQVHVRMGKLHLVDLAGSERLSKTGATGIRKDEAANINRSLTNLGIVISALVDGKSSHIPYRNSKLTRLLQDSLGGNSKTVMIANIGPADYNSDETLSTLRYANTAKRIQNRARINEDPKDAMLREFQKEIERLKEMLENEGEEETSEGSGYDERHKRFKRQKSDVHSSSMSSKAMAELKKQIEKEKEELKANKDMAEGQRNQIQSELEKKEDELRRAQEEQDELQKRLTDLESKVIVGGVNLLEKTEKQEKLLEESRKKLEKRKKKAEILKEQLKQTEAERKSYEKDLVNLQETTETMTQQLKDTWKQLQSAKDELMAVREEYQMEREYLLHDIRELNKDIGLQMLIMDSYIPHEYQELIHKQSHWDDEIGEWHIQAIAYTGNNMRGNQQSPVISNRKPYVHHETLSCYLSYDSEKKIETPLKGMGKTSRGKTRGTPSNKPPTSEGVTSNTTNYPAPRGLISRQKNFA